MRKLISGAYFSAKSSAELSRQLRRKGYTAPGEPTDTRLDDWGRVAEGFRRFDPTGENLKRLFLATGQYQYSQRQH